VSHGFHFEGGLRSEPLDLPEPTEVKPKRLENTRIKRGGVIRPDNPSVDGFDPRHSLFRGIWDNLLIARGRKKNLFFQFLLFDFLDFHPINRA